MKLQLNKNICSRALVIKRGSQAAGLNIYLVSDVCLPLKTRTDIDVT